MSGGVSTGSSCGQDTFSSVTSARLCPCDCLRCVMVWYVVNPNRVFTGALSGCRVDSVNGPDEAFTGGGACND